MYKLGTQLFVLIFLFPSLLYCQGWEHYYGDGMNTSSAAGVLDIDGNLLVHGVKPVSSASDLLQAIIYKIDSTGSLIWEYKDSGHNAELVSASDLASDAQGNHLICIRANNELPIDTSYIQKIAPSGTLLWEYDFSNSLVQSAFTMTNASDGGHLFASNLETSTGNDGISIFKLSANGNLLWETIFETPLNSLEVQDLLNASNGDIYLTGSIVKPDGSRNAILYKLTAGGTILWEKDYDHQVDEYGLQLIELSDGNFLVGGIDDVGTLIGSLRITKVDVQGFELWTRTYPNIDNGGHFGGIAEALDGAL